MRGDGFIQGCAVLVIALGSFIALTSGQNDSNYPPQHAAEHHPARKHDESDCRFIKQCVEVPMACYMHGGAPVAPECPHD